MDEHVKLLAEDLLNSGITCLSEREQRMIAKIAKRHHIARNVAEVEHETRTRGERMADALAKWGGSWTFVISFLMFLLSWASWNTLTANPTLHFDPYPFIFLNLVLSMLAAIQAPVIMMSQNRQAKIDRVQSTQNYEVNLKSELEITSLHEKIDQIMATIDAPPRSATPADLPKNEKSPAPKQKGSP